MKTVILGNRFRLLGVALVLSAAIAGCGKASRTDAAGNAASTQVQEAAVVNEGAGPAGAAATTGDAMASCGGSEHGCCGSCQEKMRAAQPAEKAMAGCPCQRARQAQEEARQSQAGS